MSFSLPPIVKLSERLLVEIEKAVRRFPRYFKYTVGADLRAKAMEVTRVAHRAWRDRQRQGDWVARLVWCVDELKIHLQLGSRVQAFASFAQFEMLSRLACDLGRQVGGWNKRKAPARGQNRGAAAPTERAQILSAHTASIDEAHV